MFNLFSKKHHQREFITRSNDHDGFENQKQFDKLLLKINEYEVDDIKILTDSNYMNINNNLKMDKP